MRFSISLSGLACLACLASLAIALAAPAHGETIIKLEPSSEPIHVRVQFESNPQNEAVVSWTTTAEGQDHKLYVDTTSRGGGDNAAQLARYKLSIPSTHSQPYTLRDDEQAAGMVAHTHNVFLGNLEPATVYYIVAVSDGKASDEFHFVTAPENDEWVQLLMVGDSRTPRPSRTHEDNDRRKVNALMARLLEKNPRIIAMAHGADYEDRAFWSQLYWWLKDHSEMTTTKNGRLLPIIPSRGNHDMDIGFEEMFWWPDRQNNYYYTTHLNSEAALITLNTMISRGGDQRNFLEAQLKELRPTKRWLLTMYHHPAYPSVRDFGDGSSQRSSWVPLFEQYQIDASFESHDHAMKRTFPIYDGEVNEERGIIYFGDGGAGVPPRNPDIDRWYIEKVSRDHHVHLLTFKNDAMELKAINIDDEIIDDFTFTQDRRTRAPQ